MSSILKRVLFIIYLFLFSSALNANEVSNLKKSFMQKIDTVVHIVEDINLSKEQRNSDIIKEVTPIFDFELMAKLSLGKIWKTLNRADKKRFIELYVERMKNSYSSKIDAYNNEKVIIKKILTPKKNRILFITDLVSKEHNLEIIYKFYKPKKQKETKTLWLIYDAEILGISILKTDKAQFREFLRTKNITELLETLQNNT